MCRRWPARLPDWCPRALCGSRAAGRAAAAWARCMGATASCGSATRHCGTHRCGMVAQALDSSGTMTAAPPLPAVLPTTPAAMPTGTLSRTARPMSAASCCAAPAASPWAAVAAWRSWRHALPGCSLAVAAAAAAAVGGAEPAAPAAALVKAPGLSSEPRGPSCPPSRSSVSRARRLLPCIAAEQAEAQGATMLGSKERSDAIAGLGFVIGGGGSGQDSRHTHLRALQLQSVHDCVHLDRSVYAVSSDLLALHPACAPRRQAHR